MRRRMFPLSLLFYMSILCFTQILIFIVYLKENKHLCLAFAQQHTKLVDFRLKKLMKKLGVTI